MQGVLEVRPFDALPGDRALVLASVLGPVAFRRDQIVLSGGHEPGEAYIIVLAGALDIEVVGPRGGTVGPGRFVGVLRPHPCGHAAQAVCATSAGSIPRPRATPAP
jgi:hypothetical protein